MRHVTVTAALAALSLGSSGFSQTCTGWCLQQVSCPGGATSISGTAYAPNSIDPLPGVLVYVPNADPDRGRFRSFLLSAFKYYLSDDADRSRAQKRGGGLPDLPFEVSKGEEMYAREQRRWARALLDRVLWRLRDEFERHGNEDRFDRLRGCLDGEIDMPYAKLARRLQTTESALKVAIHRIRKRYRRLLRSEVGEIVSDPANVDAELRYLIAAIAGQC